MAKAFAFDHSGDFVEVLAYRWLTTRDLQRDAFTFNGDQLIKQFDVRTSGGMAAASTLSGGNQQKVIVAREFSLPAVVGTGTATQKIKDGQRIRVDGGRGIVTILE